MGWKGHQAMLERMSSSWFSEWMIVLQSMFRFILVQDTSRSRFGGYGFVKALFDGNTRGKVDL